MQQEKAIFFIAVRQRKPLLTIHGNVFLHHIDGFFFGHCDLLAAQTSKQKILCKLKLVDTLAVISGQNTFIRIEPEFFCIKIEKLMEMRQRFIFRQKSVFVQAGDAHQACICHRCRKKDLPAIPGGFRKPAA